jgi:AcrR family transcriptional regulator
VSDANRSPRKRAGRQRAAHLGPERRRPQILDAARSLALHSGVGAVTIGNIATHMGVTRPVVYACFRDRVDILEALLDREEAALVGDVLGALHSSAGAATPEQAFIDGLTALLATTTRRADSWRFLFSDPDTAVSHRFQEARKLVKERTTSWIGSAAEHWWNTTDLERKLPVLIEMFMATCESGIRLVLDESNDWQPPELGAFLGSALYRAFEGA